MTRDLFVRELEALQADVLHMARIAGAAIHASVEALRNRDPARADQVIRDDDGIDALHMDLENRYMRLLVLQQPMASDLRTIAAVLAITIDLERMADHAEGISKAAKRLAHQPLLKPLIDIPRMEALVQNMLHRVVEAFLSRDVTLAEAAARMDDEVDALRSQVFRELLTYMISDPATVPRALELLLVAQHLERAADHITNMAERVIYVATGELRELNV
ncbi:MAG: phosphate signaling complex protein PhoU [Armatimonadota bacterium]|nr:phosphate signaling complex protein PhoU [Armatimonadota bacterium]MDR7543380.1 phosphate signaling complex protein PhoU [Armatimonadota bacterium]